MPTICGIIETGLYVDDMQRSVEFYNRVCGFATLYASDRITSLRVSPGQVLLLFTRGASLNTDDLPLKIPPHDGSGQQHIAFGVPPDELDAWRATLDEQHPIGTGNCCQRTCTAEAQSRKGVTWLDI